VRKRRVKLLNNKYIIYTMWNKMKLAAQIREREREMALPNRMSLHPGLLWLTLNLALSIQCLSWNIYIYIYIFFFYFNYPLRCLHILQVEYHWGKGKVHPITFHEGTERKYRHNSTLSLTSALDWDVWLMPCLDHITPRNDLVPIV
jgi:hypothetical protein